MANFLSGPEEIDILAPSDEPIETFDDVPGRRKCSWVNGHYICVIELEEQSDD